MIYYEDIPKNDLYLQTDLQFAITIDCKTYCDMIEFLHRALCGSMKMSTKIGQWECKPDMWIFQWYRITVCTRLLIYKTQRCFDWNSDSSPLTLFWERGRSMGWNALSPPYRQFILATRWRWLSRHSLSDAIPALSWGRAQHVCWRLPFRLSHRGYRRHLSSSHLISEISLKWRSTSGRRTRKKW